MRAHIVILWVVVVLLGRTECDLDWEWGSMIYERCTQKVGMKTPPQSHKYKGLCSRLQEVVEGTFSKAGNMVHNAYQTSHWDMQRILKHSAKSGEAMIDEFINWGMENWPLSERDCVIKFGQRFIPWYKSVLDRAIDEGRLPELKDSL